MVVEEFDRTIFIMETPPRPPATHRRWYCHGTPGFDTPDEGVEWALSQTDLVMVRPLDGPYYWAGTEPTEWDDEEWPLRPWPPSEEERRAIDANRQGIADRIAEVNRIAPKLAEAIADRIAKVLPDGWTARAAAEPQPEPAVVLLRDGKEVYSGGVGNFEIWELYGEILSGVQDEISEETTDAWPHDPARRMHMWVPEIEVVDDEIRAWYGPRDDPVLTLEPIDLARLRS